MITNSDTEVARRTIYNASSHFRAFAKFPLPTVGVVSSAILHFSLNNLIIDETPTINVHSSNDVSWDETTGYAALEAISIGSVLYSFEAEDGSFAVDITAGVQAAYAASATHITVIWSMTGSTANNVETALKIGPNSDTWTIWDRDGGVWAPYIAITHDAAPSELVALSAGVVV
jgi:hypothetical protein